MNVVLDTNIIVSGLFFGGAPRGLLDLAGSRKIIPCFTIQTLQELERVLLHEKFSVQRESLSFPVPQFLNQFKTCFRLFERPRLDIQNVLSQDPSDREFLICALAADAEYIVSGDAHLLSLKQFQEIPILSPKRFLSQFDT